MAISKIGKSLVREIASPLNVGFGAASMSMGQPVPGVIGGLAASTLAGKGLSHVLPKLTKFLPGAIGAPLGWAADMYLSTKAMSMGEHLGNKLFSTQKNNSLREGLQNG